MSPSMPESSPEQTERLTFEQDLATVEQALQELRQRHTQVLQDQQRQAELGDRRERIHQIPHYRAIPELRAELQQIEAQLGELEVNLESRLFSWSSLKRPFWQIVRFGGLGFVLGWGLAYATLRSPQLPPPPPSPSNESAP